METNEDGCGVILTIHHYRIHQSLSTLLSYSRFQSCVALRIEE